MRRRLWYMICLLDLHASFDRASKPLIAPDSPHPALPRNINDSEFDPDFYGDVPDREGITDMTKSLILFNAQAHGKVLNFGATGEPPPRSWEARHRVADSFEHATAQLLRNCNPDASPYAWYTVRGAASTVAAMRLHALRPMSLSLAGSVPPPAALGYSYLLELAVTLLTNERRNRADPRAEGFRWFEMVHWYPLAVALAECYACQDTALIRRCWPMIEGTFEHEANVVADYRDGKLWRPMQKLMRKTRGRVQPVLKPRNGIHNVSSLPGEMVPPLRTDPESAPSQMAQAGMSLSVADNSMPIAPVKSPPILSPFDAQMNGTMDASPPVVVPASTTHIWFSQGLLGNGFDAISQLNAVPPASATDSAWGTWASFVNDLTFDDMAGAGFPGSVYDGNPALTGNFGG